MQDRYVEVDDESHTRTRQLQVGQQLRFVDAQQSFYRFQFDQDLIGDDQIECDKSRLFPAPCIQRATPLALGRECFAAEAPGTYILHKPTPEVQDQAADGPQWQHR